MAKDTDKLEEIRGDVGQGKTHPRTIVAFGDIGTSAATTIVTIALENTGYSDCHMTAPPGSAIAEGVAVYRAGNLCLCPIDVYQASTPEEVRAIDLKWDYIIGALTASEEKLAELAQIDFKMDQVPPAENGPAADYRRN